MGTVRAGISILVKSWPGGDTILQAQSFDPNFDIKVLLVFLQDDGLCFKNNYSSFPVTIFELFVPTKGFD